MSSPARKIIYCLFAIACAGIPLLWFETKTPALTPSQTAPDSHLMPPHRADSPAELPVLVRFSGKPVEICIYHMGERLCTISPTDADGKWGGKLPLPVPGSGSPLELEVEATWPEPCPTPQAITIEITPPGRPIATYTQWSDNQLLHSIFIFQW